MAKAEKPVLMSRDNPEGWKLEELCSQLIAEIEGKTASLEADKSLAARHIAANNSRIVDLLGRARTVQAESMATLDRIRPNEGPHGRPRIGPGSED